MEMSIFTLHLLVEYTLKMGPSQNQAQCLSKTIHLQTGLYSK